MPNPVRTQAQFDAFADRWLHPLRKAAAIKELLERFQKTDTVIVEQGDVSSYVGTWDLDGVVIGTNTDSAGRIFVRITGTGPYTVKGYKATGGGGGDEMFTGAGAAGATVTLTAVNSSGITGTVVLGGSPAAATGDTIRLRCLPGMALFDRAVFTGSDSRDGDLIAAHQAFNAQAVRALTSLEQSAAAIMRRPDVVEWTAAFVKSGTGNGLFSPATEVDDDAVTLAVTGVIEDLREAMEDNTTVQSIPVTTLSSGSVVYDSGNAGAGVLAVGAALPVMTAGTLILKCTDEAPPERFEVTFRPDDVTEPTLVGQNDLVVGKEWNDPAIPLSLTLARDYTKTGDGSNVNLSATDGSFTGVTRSNSDGGVLYGKTVANGSNWNLEFYKDSARTQLVAKATNIATAAAFTATQQNRSGLSVSWTAGSAPVNGNTYSIDANLFSVGPPADVISLPISRSATGVIQDLVRRLVGWYLNQSGSPTIPDSLVQRGSKFNQDAFA